MSKSFRIRTQVGEDQKLTFEVKQDFDLLEILSFIPNPKRCLYTNVFRFWGSCRKSNH